MHHNHRRCHKKEMLTMEQYKREFIDFLTILFHKLMQLLKALYLLVFCKILKNSKVMYYIIKWCSLI